MGWQCVVKKGEVKVGERVVYFQVDSILPQKPEFEFLRERKFRIKTIKLRGVYSQGLIIPLPAEVKDFPVGADATSIMGVKKFDRSAKEEKELSDSQDNTKTNMPQWLMDMAWFRYVYFKLNPKNKGNFPSWIGKTDESRIAVCAKVLMDHFDESWYITEKMDGSSLSAFQYLKRVWGFNAVRFGVASRNIWLKSENDSKYWSIAKKLALQRKFKEYFGKEVATLQAELCGIGIQGNKYGLSENELFVFNIIHQYSKANPLGKRMTLETMRHACRAMGLKTVPIINENFIPSVHLGIDFCKDCEKPDIPTVVNALMKMANGKSVLKDRLREGLVFRLNSDPSISFKVVSPEFSLENDD